MTGQTLVLGTISGSIYGLIALGIVLVYRGSRVLNFAQGEIGTFALFVAYFFITKHHWPWLLGAAMAVGVAALMGAGFDRFVVRRMVDASRMSVAVATIALLTLIIAVEFQAFGDGPRVVPPPVSGDGFEVAGVVVSPTHVLALIAAIVIGLGLAAFLRRTDFGLGVLAAAEDPTAVRLVGVPLGRVSTFVWAAGAAVSAVAMLLIEPTIGVFAPAFGSKLFVYGLAAALVGGLSSLPGAFVGGITVGMLEVGVKAWAIDHAVTTPGLEVVVVFVLILAVLLVRPQGLLGGRARA